MIFYIKKRRKYYFYFKSCLLNYFKLQLFLAIQNVFACTKRYIENSIVCLKNIFKFVIIILLCYTMAKEAFSYQLSMIGISFFFQNKSIKPTSSLNKPFYTVSLDISKHFKSMSVNYVLKPRQSIIESKPSLFFLHMSFLFYDRLQRNLSKRRTRYEAESSIKRTVVLNLIKNSRAQ